MPNNTKHTSSGYKFLKKFGSQAGDPFQKTQGTFAVGDDLLFIPITMALLAQQANMTLIVKGFYGGLRAARVKFELDAGVVYDALGFMREVLVPALQESLGETHTVSYHLPDVNHYCSRTTTDGMALILLVKRKKQ